MLREGDCLLGFGLYPVDMLLQARAQLVFLAFESQSSSLFTWVDGWLNSDDIYAEPAWLSLLEN